MLPKELQAAAIQLAPEGHLGQEITLGLLRETSWFSGLSQRVKEYISSCIPCLAATPGTPREPLKPITILEKHWRRVHADFKGPIAKRYYLHTIIDQYSKYPVVEVCSSTDWESMEDMLTKAFSMFGNVEEMITDGGPPYDSRGFRKFAKRQGFNHHICTPENPEANGFVEVFNKVLVKMIHTATIEGEDPTKVVNRYLAQYKASPHKTTGKSPFELMFGRKMRTKLPERRGREEEEVETRKKHDEAKLKQKEYVDGKKGTREKILKPGDKILLQRKKTTTKSPWDPVPYEVDRVKGSEVTARRGDEVKRRAKNNVKPVKPRPQFFQALQRRKNQNKEEEDWEEDLDKILGRKAPETQEHESRKEQIDSEARGSDTRIQG